MATKIFKSFGLILVTFAGTWMFGPPWPGFGIWVILFSLFLVSRRWKSVKLFQKWSWFQFLATLVAAIVLPYFLMFVFFPGF